ncbi:MAG: helix-turn-helix domain-containing protein [Clostridium sp.]|uniref:helix-turn-helix domain-containing protein n=1 Tax=Clostridium sp. TaxID=1506 RepID=UPI003D6C885C
MKDKNFVYTTDKFLLVHNYTGSPIDVDTHIHNCYEIYYCISGDFTYHVEGQSYKLQKNDLIITNTRELHRIVFDTNEGYERKFIQFKPEYISSFQSEEYNMLSFIQKRKLGQFNKVNAKDVMCNGIDKLWQQISKYAHEKSPENSIMIKAIFVQMLIGINKIFASNSNVPMESLEYDEVIIDILKYIKDNLAKKITLDILEAEFHINKYYICHLFKKNTGFTVIEYIIYKRIMKAEELLILGTPIIDVSSQVGFGDYTNFYKAFKKILGVSPKKYMNR